MENLPVKQNWKFALDQLQGSFHGTTSHEWSISASCVELGIHSNVCSPDANDAWQSVIIIVVQSVINDQTHTQHRPTGNCTITTMSEWVSSFTSHSTHRTSYQRRIFTGSQLQRQRQQNSQLNHRTWYIKNCKNCSFTYKQYSRNSSACIPQAIITRQTLYIGGEGKNPQEQLQHTRPKRINQSVYTKYRQCFGRVTGRASDMEFSSNNSH